MHPQSHVTLIYSSSNTIEPVILPHTLWNNKPKMCTVIYTNWVTEHNEQQEKIRLGKQE
jgi:hypothetical protein